MEELQTNKWLNTPSAGKGCPTSEKDAIQLKLFVNNLPSSSQTDSTAYPFPKWLLSLAAASLEKTAPLSHQLFLIYPVCPSISAVYLSIYPSIYPQGCKICLFAEMRKYHTSRTRTHLAGLLDGPRFNKRKSAALEGWKVGGWGRKEEKGGEREALGMRNSG